MGIVICDRVIMFFLSLMIFFLPISKAVIEVSAIFCILIWSVKQLFHFVKLLLRLIGDLRNGKEIVFINKLKSFLFNGLTLNGALMLFILANLLSVIFSSNIQLSINTFFLKLAEYILIFLIVRDTVNTKQRYKLIINVVLFSLLFIGLDGFFQIVAKHDLFRQRTLFLGRVTASFENPNDLGSYLITVIPLSLLLIFTGLGKKIKAVLISIFLIAISALMFTFSKGAWLAFLIALLFFGLNTKKRYVVYAFLGILAIGLILPIFFNFSAADLVGRLSSFSSDAGAIDRKYLWQAAIRMFMAKPVLGVGLGTFMENYPIFWVRPTTEIAYTHNCYLQTLAETGIIGLGAFLLFLFIWLKRTLEVFSRRSHSFFYFSFLGLSTGIITYLLNSFVDTNLYSLPIAVLFWFILGLQQAAGKIIENEK